MGHPPFTAGRGTMSSELARLHCFLIVFFVVLCCGVVEAADKKRDYYEVLGIEKGADTQAVKRAYKKMALKWHPDKNPDDKETAEVRFREVAEAYEVLSDPEKRKQYDAYGHDAPQGGGGHGFSGFDFGGGFGFKDPKDLFKDMFGDSDPFADFAKFFDDIEETVTGEDNNEAQNKLAEKLSAFYTAVGQSDKAGIDKVKEVLSMPKFANKRKMFKNLQKKYSEPQHQAALKKLEAAVNEFEKSRPSGGSGFGGFGGGDPFEGFGGLGGFGGGGGGFGGFGGGGGGLGDIGGVFEQMGFGGGFGGGGGGGGASTMSFSSTTYSGAGGKTVKSETKMSGGKRVTKTIESDGKTTKASMEESDGKTTKRRSGVKHAEALPSDEM